MEFPLENLNLSGNFSPYESKIFDRLKAEYLALLDGQTYEYYTAKKDLKRQGELNQKLKQIEAFYSNPEKRKEYRVTKISGKHTEKDGVEREIKFDLNERLEYWRDFYADNNVDWIQLPGKISVTLEQENEMQRLIEEYGFDHIIVIPENLVDQPEIQLGTLVKPAEHYQKLHQLMSPKGSRFWDDGNSAGVSLDKTFKFRIILTRDVQNLQDDQLFRQTLGQSLEDLKAEDGVFAQHQVHGLAESEYLVYQREYNQRTKQHLDPYNKSWTFLPESQRPLNRRNLAVYWNSPNEELYFGALKINGRESHLGCRLAKAFEIET